MQTSRVPKGSPDRVPFEHRFGRIETAPLAGRPQVMLRFRVAEQIGPFKHPSHRFDRRRVERDHPMARHVLTPSNVRQALDKIHIATTKVLHLDRPHRRVGSDDRGAVHVLPLGFRGGSIEKALLLFWRQRSADGALTFRKVVDVVSEGSPTTAELQHTGRSSASRG